MNNLKKEKTWSVLYRAGDHEKDCLIEKISRENGISKICAQILYNRGFDTPEKAAEFFSDSSIDALYDPFLMKDIEKAESRIRSALEAHEKIAIYGDYDVDGVTSVTLLYLYLKSYGADVTYYIPSRSKEGYGLSCEAIDTLSADNVKLIITVDTGITANEEADHARECGIDMVITDHHECHDQLPDACAVVNIHRPDCLYPFKELAGVGVVFKVLCACEIKRCREAGLPDSEGVGRICQKYADLVAIGTIADVMPVIDENRFIITEGLRKIENTTRPGLAALITAISGDGSDRKKRKINSGFIGYGIAPRINAAGRISTATKAVELLLSEDEESAKLLAEELCEINSQRQLEENRIAEQAYKMIEQEFDLENTRVIVLDNDSWHQGIIGIVASRITEKYGLPSILISFDGATRGYPFDDDIGKGSGRSIKGINLVSAMNECRDLLVRYGGHELAAGLTIMRGNIPDFREKINEYAKSQLNESDFALTYEADCEVQMTDLTMPLAIELNRLEPFGVANQTPELVLRDVTIQKIIPLGTGKHTKLILSRDGMTMQAVWFGMPISKFRFLTSDCVDIMFQLNINEYQNVRSLQLIVQDMKICERYENECKAEKERYAAIHDGAEYSTEEDILPTREDIAMVYKLIRSEFRIGHTTFSERMLLSMINTSSEFKINYIKLKFIIRVLQELQICGVSEFGDGIYVFDVYNNVTKTNLDKSSILKKLRSQRRDRGNG